MSVIYSTSSEDGVVLHVLDTARVKTGLVDSTDEHCKGEMSVTSTEAWMKPSDRARIGAKPTFAGILSGS